MPLLLNWSDESKFLPNVVDCCFRQDEDAELNIQSFDCRVGKNIFFTTFHLSLLI